MRDYYRFRMKLLRSAEGGSASTLYSWIGLAGVPLIIAMFIVGAELRSAEYFYAVSIVVGFYFFAHLSEVYPKIGSWLLLSSSSAGTLYCVWLLLAALADVRVATPSHSRFALSAFLIYFLFIFRAALRQRQRELNRNVGDMRIPCLVLTTASVTGLVASVAASLFATPLEGQFAWTLTQGAYFAIATACISLVILVQRPLRPSAWKLLLSRVPSWLKRLVIVIYVAVAIEVVVLAAALGRSTEAITFLIWHASFSLSALLSAWGSMFEPEASS